MSELTAASSALPSVPPLTGGPVSPFTAPQTDAPAPVAERPVRDDVLSLRSLMGKPELDPVAFERQMLDTERDVLEATRHGLLRADTVLQAAQATLGDLTVPENARQQRLLTLGAQVAQIAETTQAHSAFPLVEAGELHYPHVTLMTFTLFGTDDQALIQPQPFLPGVAPVDADQQMQQMRARLEVADASLVAQREALDHAGLRLAANELDLHPAVREIPPAVPSGFSGAEHGRLDPLRTVALLTP